MNITDCVCLLRCWASLRRETDSRPVLLSRVAFQSKRAPDVNNIVWFSINHHALRGPNYVGDNIVVFLPNCITQQSLTLLAITSVLFTEFKNLI